MVIELTWAANPASDNVTTYKVYHGNTNACGTLLTSTPFLSASVPPEGLGYQPGSIIYVGVSAVNAQGESAKTVLGPFAVPSPAVASVPSGVVAAVH